MQQMFIMTAVTAGALALPAIAQEPREMSPDKAEPEKVLTVGDEAPKIDIAHWVKGDKVGEFEDGKVYVVEFWATWCGPCRDSMPHLASLQKEYKDYGVSFISVSDEPLDTVTSFLKKPHKKDAEETWDQIITYRLTTDPDKSVMNDYHAAAGMPGIPSAFIVGKDQRIEWIGNPHPKSGDNFDKALDAVVKDSWDRKAFKAEFEKEHAETRKAMEEQRNQMKDMEPLMNAVQAGEWDKAIEVADRILEKNPKNIGVGLTKFRVLAVEKGETDKAYAFAREFMEENDDNPMALNAIAWTIVDDEGIKKRDFDLALDFATRANKLTEEKNPAILDTLARCHYEKGNLAEAVKYQQMAADNAEDDEMGTDIKATLEKYKSEHEKKGG